MVVFGKLTGKISLRNKILRKSSPKRLGHEPLQGTPRIQPALVWPIFSLAHFQPAPSQPGSNQLGS
jgi:hypothetical protein